MQRYFYLLFFRIFVEFSIFNKGLLCKKTLNSVAKKMHFTMVYKHDIRISIVTCNLCLLSELAVNFLGVSNMFYTEM